MDLTGVAAALRTEAESVNERRLLVLAGDRTAGYAAAETALDAATIDRDRATVVGSRDGLRCERVRPKRANQLLGTTRDAVVVDCHDAFRPNALGQVVGAVDGGGLLVLLTPPLDEWPDRRDDFDSTLAVPPFAVGDVTGNFRRRLVRTLREHDGVAIVDVDAEVVESDGRTHPAPRLPEPSPDRPADAAFPRAAFDACLTADQVAVVREFEALQRDGRAVVVEADRGRGKSSAAGIAAGSLAAEGADVLVTAPEYRSASEVFVRASALLADLDALAGPADARDRDQPRRIDAAGGGSIRFASPADAADLPGDPDVVLVDEAAALPVRLLERFLAADRVAFTTTVHGYEGAGRGFSVRFRDRLAETDHEVTESRLDDPIRYAAGDPVEVWAFRALLLDARPPVEQVVADATPDTVSYRRLDPADLLADDHLLSEAFGLLVLAHYRTEPDDLARLLDAPNLSARALVRDGRVVAVALLAREGGLPADVRADMYDGGRVKGNMLPDVLTTQLRDETAGVPVGYRVMRVATHHAVRSRGLGSRLLAEIRAEFEEEVDWLGVGFGATPELLSFWRANGYSTVQLSTTRNDTSGEYSALMLAPTSDAGRELRDRTARRFVRRVGGVLSDPLDDLDADVARAALAAVSTGPDGDGDAVPGPTPDLTPWEWRVVAASAYGPGMFDVAPSAFRRVAVAHLVEGACDLSARRERVLVRKVLQGRPWDDVADELGFHSSGQCMRALGDAFEPLVDRYGDETALAERDRYSE